ncbi:probable flavin-containing monoamine oxidase A [Branchiostoma floridae]|uniref:Amine oxidase n=1 Tax=Branchiostoma floridae TaxID=7739 RepID=A0A9J7N8I9_BRAFL|nr:probable flavin-containing monoamine oxidase A [Branchiostoma floridae]XP_035694430.1 probable flavin-containing monoamine oxidase A [Branchiostoma floridae]
MAEEGPVESVDVVVVGGGLSGLSSAYHLSKRNSSCRILVLEAKGRVGGRTETVPLQGAGGQDTWDLGGMWVGRTQLHILQLLQELGLQTYPQYTRGYTVMQLGSAGRVAKYRSDSPIPNMPLHSLIDVQLFIWKVERMRKQVPPGDPGSCPHAREWDSMTVETFKQKNLWTQAAKDAVDIACWIVYGVDASRISLLYYLHYTSCAGGLYPLVETTKGSGQELKIKGGAQQVCELMVQKIGRENVWLNQPVTHITQQADGVTLTTAGGRTVQAQRVICSVPPHLAGRIEYSPPLPMERDHLTQNMPVGHTIKYVATYRRAFWRDRDFSGEVVAYDRTADVDGCDTGPIQIAYDNTTGNGNPGLVAFMCANYAKQWASKSIEQRKAAVLKKFAECFGEEAYDPLDFAEKDWGTEPYNGGCPISIMGPGVITNFIPALRRPCGRIHWAGTETASLWCGFMNGAVQSGIRAAGEVLSAMSPHLLSEADRQELVAVPQEVETPAKEAHRKKGRKVVSALVGVGLVVGTSLAVYYYIKT